MATFALLQGSFSVKPAKPYYKTGEKVTLNVAYDVSKSGWTGGAWSVNVEVYNSAGVLLDRDGETNAEWTSRSISTLESPKLHPQFLMSNITMLIRAKLVADSTVLGTVVVAVPLTVVVEPTPPEPEPTPTASFILLDGSFIVKPDKSQYRANDTVKLYVGYDVTRNANVGVSWSVNASVYSAAGTLLDKDGETNAFTTSRSISSPDSSAVVHPQFKMSSTSMQVKVVLEADGTKLGQTTVTVPISVAPAPTEPEPYEPTPTEPTPTPTEPEPTEPTVGGIPTKWLAIGVVGLLLVMAMGGGKKEGLS